MHCIKDIESNFRCYFLMIFSSNRILERETRDKGNQVHDQQAIRLEVCNLLFVLAFKFVKQTLLR